MKIDRHIIEQANEVKFKLAPIVKSLNELTDHHFRYDDKNVFGEIKKTTNLLVSKIDAANKIINESQARYDARDQVLISNAVTAMMAIPSKIESLEKSGRNISENYKRKIDDLTHKRYSPDEIQRLLPIEERDKQISDNINEIESLKSDHIALEKFVADNPNYDVAIIKNTQFYQYFTDKESFFRGQS